MGGHKHLTTCTKIRYNNPPAPGIKIFYDAETELVTVVMTFSPTMDKTKTPAATCFSIRYGGVLYDNALLGGWGAGNTYAVEFSPCSLPSPTVYFYYTLGEIAFTVLNDGLYDSFFVEGVYP